jgi:hypothetical protein
VRWLDRLQTSTLGILALLAVFIAATIASPYLPYTTIHAQQVGPGGVPGAGGGGGGAVSSVFGRTGAVVAATGDYTAAQVANAAATNVANVFTGNPQTVEAASFPQIQLVETGTDTSLTLFEDAGAAVFDIGGVGGLGISLSGPYVANGQVFGWSSTLVGPVPALDTGLSRVSAGVIAVGTGSQGSTAGTLEASQYNVGSTPGFTGTVTISGCSITVQGGIITAATGC